MLATSNSFSLLDEEEEKPCQTLKEEKVEEKPVKHLFLVETKEDSTFTSDDGKHFLLAYESESKGVKYTQDNSTTSIYLGPFSHSLKKQASLRLENVLAPFKEEVKIVGIANFFLVSSSTINTACLCRYLNESFSLGSAPFKIKFQK